MKAEDTKPGDLVVIRYPMNDEFDEGWEREYHYERIADMPEFIKVENHTPFIRYYSRHHHKHTKESKFCVFGAAHTALHNKYPVEKL